jgi:hypothetical protein
MSTSLVNKKKREKIRIAEEFVPVDTKFIDSKNRITLGGKIMKFVGKHLKFDSYQVFLSTAGDILLRPSISIPSSEAWIYENPKVIRQIRKGLNEAKEGKIKEVDNLDEFLDKL